MRSNQISGHVRNLMAWLELNLRGGAHERHNGIDLDVRYHLYNWIQAEQLVPYGAQDVFEELAEVKDCLAQGDAEGASGVLDSLIERFEACARPPDVD